jgi:O-antigen/teichoic acid export membrane protein
VSPAGERELDPAAVRSAQLFAARVVGNLGYFAAVLLLARGLGPAGRGEIAFLIVTSLVLARLAAFGIVESTTIFAAQRQSARATQLSTAIAFAAAGSTAVASLVGVGLLLLGESGAAGISAAELAVLVAATMAVAIADAGYAFLLGCDRIREQAVIGAASSWIYAVLLAAAWAVDGLTVVRAALIWAIAQALRATWVLDSSARGTGFAPPSASLLGESIRFGVRAWVGSLSRFLNFRADQVLMGFIATESALGVYAVAVNASEVLLYLPSATAVALLPLAARSDPLRRADLVLRAFRSAALITGAGMLVAALVGPPLLPLVFGPDFRGSVVPFLLLLPGALGFTAMGVFSSALVASSLPGRSSLGPLVSLALGLALAVILIPRFGASGAAAAASAAFLAGGTISLAVYRRRVRFGWSSLLLPRRGDLDVLRALAAPLRRGPVLRGRT